MTSRFSTAAGMSRSASAAYADAASSCSCSASSASFDTALFSVDAARMASILLFTLLAGLVCLVLVRPLLGIILPLLAVIVMAGVGGVVCGKKGASETDRFA